MPEILSIMSPKWGETWKVGDSKGITWTPASTITEKIKISISVDNGESWTIISKAVENNGSVYIKVPKTPGDKSYIKLSGSDWSITSGRFKIKKRSFLEKALLFMKKLFESAKELE